MASSSSSSLSSAVAPPRKRKEPSPPEKLGSGLCGNREFKVPWSGAGAERQEQMRDCKAPFRRVTCFFSQSAPPFNHLSNFTHTKTPFAVDDKKFYSIEHAYAALKFSVSGASPVISGAFEADGKLGKADGVTIKRFHGKKSFKLHGVALNTERLDRERPAFLEKCILARAGVDPLYKSMLIDHARNGIPIFHFERSKNYFRKRGDDEDARWVGGNMLGNIMFRVGKALLSKFHM